AIGIADSLRDDWLAIRVFWCNLVERDGDPLADRQVGKSGAHGRITRNDSVKDYRVALRKNHALAAARGTSREIRKSRRLPVVLRDELFGQSGDLGVREIGEIQIRLLVFHE